MVPAQNNPPCRGEHPSPSRTGLGGQSMGPPSNKGVSQAPLVHCQKFRLQVQSSGCVPPTPQGNSYAQLSFTLRHVEPARGGAA